MDWDNSPSESENDESSEIESNGSDSDDTEMRDFDRNLPAEHSYLPGGLTTTSGRSVLEPGWTGRMPCWCHDNIVFPGETIPLLFTEGHDLTAMQNVLEGDRLFGLLFVSSDSSLTYGVLCEVVEAGRFQDIPSLRPTMSFKTRARQRFIKTKILESCYTSVNRRLMCEIKILPDIVLRDPLTELKFRCSQSKSQTRPRSKVNKFLHNSDSVCTPWPRFVYDIFDEKAFIADIKEYFKNYQFENFPPDLLSLSFWVASNLAISVEERLKLFSIDNAFVRLFLESKHIKKHKNRMLCCKICLTEICDKEEITAMSNEGICNNYCNIGGFVHDIITVQRVNNVVLQGRPSIKFTWFPGYLWTIASCTACGNHVGWRFTANKKSLRPQEFWGLARKSLKNKKLAYDASQSE